MCNKHHSYHDLRMLPPLLPGWLLDAVADPAQVLAPGVSPQTSLLVTDIQNSTVLW